MAEETRTPPVTTVSFSQEVTSTSVPRTNRQTPWRQRRYTPYNKTPVTRNLRSGLKTTATSGVTTAAKYRTPPSADRQTSRCTTSQEFLNKTWNVYRMSPLYKFSYAPADLRQYARALSAHLEVENLKNQAVKVENEEANLAIFSALRGLKKLKADAEAVKIYLKKKAKTGNGEATVVTSAILLSVHASARVLQTVPEEFTVLPVMLVKGTVALSRCLTQWLQVQFDCVIHPMVFPPVNLWWLVSMWAGSVPDTDKRHRSVELQYKVPAEVEGLSTITMTIDAEDCRKLWKCIHKNSDDSFHETEVVAFIKNIEAHFRHHFEIDIHAMPLCKVGTSVACVGAEGRLKIFSADHVSQILSHVTECVTDMTLMYQ